MQITALHSKYDELQQIHGDPTYTSIYGAGCVSNPDVCLIFMNPTARNISSHKEWKGLRAPWIGTKQIWKLFKNIGRFDEELFVKIQGMKSEDWDEDFADKVYEEVARKKIFITNLAKCTLPDARKLSNDVFRDYLDLMKKEIEGLNPKVVVTFGNQVSSVYLGQQISVSKVRKKVFNVEINSKKYTTYSIYYPVGQGMRNIDKSIEDLRYVLRCTK